MTSDEGHYAAIIMEMEARGAKVVPMFAGNSFDSFVLAITWFLLKFFCCCLF